MEILRPEYISSLEGLIAFAIPIVISALSVEQRLWVLRRDNFKCQVKELGIDHPCNGHERWKNGHFKLEVDHLIPSRWQQRVLGKTENEADAHPELMLTECVNYHQNIRHPDMQEAKAGYSHNKDSYKIVFKRRDEACDRKEKYWFSLHDNIFLRRAADNTHKMREKLGKYPEKNHNGKT